jgi:hypothetical protein
VPSFSLVGDLCEVHRLQVLRGFMHLNMDGPGVNDVSIFNFFTTDSVDVFRFSDKTLTTQQVKEISVDE